MRILFMQALQARESEAANQLSALRHKLAASACEKRAVEDEANELRLKLSNEGKERAKLKADAAAQTEGAVGDTQQAKTATQVGHLQDWT